MCTYFGVTKLHTSLKCMETFLFFIFMVLFIVLFVIVLTVILQR